MNGETGVTREEVMRKLAALLRLAARPGTAGEAAAAAGRAQALMDRWELTRAEIELDGGRALEPDEGMMDFGNRPEGELGRFKKVSGWHLLLGAAIARQNGCFAYRSVRKDTVTLELVGRPSQVEAVRYLYAYLSVEIDRLARDEGLGMTATWRTEFKLGAVTEVEDILRKRRDETMQGWRNENAGNKHALVVVQNALQRLDPADARRFAFSQRRFTKGHSGRASNGHDPTAREAGAAAARRINMGGGPGIGPGTRQ